MNKNGDQVIKVGIEKSRSNFFKLNEVLCNRNQSLSLRLRIVRRYVFSVLLYGVETWTLVQNTTRKLEAFRMCVYHRS